MTDLSEPRTPRHGTHVVGVGPVSQSRNRIRIALNESYAEANNAVSWAESDNIHEVTCLVTATAGEVSQAFTQNYINVVVNAANAVVAEAMLTEVDSPNSDTQIDRFLIGERFVIRSKTAITRLDFLPVDKGASMSAIQLWVGAH